MFLHERADYGTHFDFDTTSGKTDGKLLKGMKNHFDTAEFSSYASSTQTRSKYNKYRGKVREWTITSTQVGFSR